MSTADERRRARAAWPIRRVALEDEGRPDPLDASTIDDRIALVWTLTRRQCEFAGQPIPSYARADMPGTIIRRR